MKSPEYISVKKYVDSSKLKQCYYDVPNHLKFSLLVHLLKNEKSNIIMVFCNTRRNVDLVAMNLKRYDLNSLAIHGGLEQGKRNRIMEKLHNNQVNILVCTDVAARGLDIKNVTHVYNYDIPKTAEEYTHRIGRTARAGKEGMAINIVTNRDYESFGKIMNPGEHQIEKRELPKIEKLSPNFQDKKRQSFGRSHHQKPQGHNRNFRRPSSNRNFRRPHGRSFRRR